MKVLYTSDLHGEIRLYQELLALAISSSAEIIALGGDLLPSLPPTKQYEDMVPNQKAFIVQFLSPYFRRIVVCLVRSRLNQAPCRHLRNGEFEGNAHPYLLLLN